MWLTKILYLVPSFPKVHVWSLWFVFCNAFSPNFCQKYMEVPSGLHFVTHLVTKSWGLNVLQSANHKDHPCTFGKS
ncbi:hypothetical protein Hanom_Chr03g00244921 [Helianthus anomalus]